MKITTYEGKDLQKFRDNLSRDLYGKTTEEAIKENACIQCSRVEDKWYSEAGRKEFFISGLCEYCFDEITGG